MAENWRKYGYNRLLFGQRVKEYRVSLGWTLGHLSRVSGINRGTLQQVEEGERSLPNDKRCKLVDVLAEALENTELHVSRREFLELAGIQAGVTVLNTLTPREQAIENPGTMDNTQRSVEGQALEEYAETLNVQQDWVQAEIFWLLAGRNAESIGNWIKWAKCILNAGQMALNLNQFEVAESRFNEILSHNEDTVGTIAVVEAHLRLGWLYYEQEDFGRAAKFLIKSRILLHKRVNKNLASLRLPEHRFTLVCEGDEAILGLEESIVHFLGRTYSDWGIKENNPALVREGLVKLQESCDYNRKLGLDKNIGFALLRQIPILVFEGEMRIAERLLSQGKELLGEQGTGAGHIYFHRGLLAIEEKPQKAREFFERALEGFVEPVFYPKGLSEILREIGIGHLMDGKKFGDQKALQYAVVSTILSPYGRSLEVLGSAAHKTYWHLGESISAFNKYWQDLEEKLWCMDSEPFSDLRHLLKSFGFDRGKHHLEMAMRRASEAINDELKISRQR